METILAHKEGVLYGLAGFFLFGWLLAKMPDIIINWAIAHTDAMFAAGDVADDKLLLAFLRWVNEKFGPKTPDDQSWPLKINAAALRLIALLPFVPVRMFFTLHADKIKELCVKLYELGIAAAQREAAKHEHDNDPVDTPPPVA